jgi:uncharacterized protein (DUF58 family)
LNFGKLNHILIPGTRDGRDRLRHSRAARLLGPLTRAYLGLTVAGRFLAVFSVAALLFSLSLQRTQNYLLWAAVFSLLAASLAARRVFRLPGVTLGVEAPARVPARTPACFTLRIENAGPLDEHALELRPPFLPWDGAWLATLAPVASLPAGGLQLRTLSATFVERGPHHLDPFEVTALVPLGIARGPAVASGGARFLVTPYVAPVRALALPPRASGAPGGTDVAPRRGHSPDLLGVRPYRPGDRIRDLHARSWARTGEPVVREYQRESAERVALVLDTDGRAGEEEFEAALSLGAGLLAHLAEQRTTLDLWIAGPEIEVLHLERGEGARTRALDRLAVLQRAEPFAPDALARRLAPELERLGALVFVGALWDAPQRAFADGMRERGLPVRALIAARGGPIAGATAVPLDAIRGREPLEL